MFSIFLFSLMLNMGAPGRVLADQFNLDLSKIDPSYGTYNDIFRIQADGYSILDQKYGNDYTFSDGDEFTETSILQKLSYKNSLQGTKQEFSGLKAAGKIMYLYAKDLAGTVSNVQGTGANTTFDYSFYAGSGSDIGVYIADDTGSLVHDEANAVKIASLVLEAGNGSGADGFFGGLPNAGTTRMKFRVLPETQDGVWTVGQYDLNNNGLFAINTTNQVITRQEYDKNNDGKFEGFDANINSTGHLEVSVTPEPATMALLGFGLLGVAGVSRKKFLKKG